MWTLAAPGKWVSRAAPQRIRGTRATPGPRPQPPCRGGPRSCVCCFCWGWGPRAPCPHPVTGRSGEGGWGWGRKARVWRLGSDLRCWGVIPGEGSGGKKLAFGVGGGGQALCQTPPDLQCWKRWGLPAEQALAAQRPPSLHPWLQPPPQTVQGFPQAVLGNFLPVLRFSSFPSQEVRSSVRAQKPSLV